MARKHTVRNLFEANRRAMTGYAFVAAAGVLGCGADAGVTDVDAETENPVAGQGGSAAPIPTPIDGGSKPFSTCVPNSQAACACLAGQTGFQACNADGTAFDACRCEAPVVDAGALAIDAAPPLDIDAGALPDAGAILGTTTTLYIHGRNTDGPDGEPSGWTYWGHQRPGVNARPVNWKGKKPIGITNPTIQDALDTYCTGDDWCYVACHSAGCAQLGYALDLFGDVGSDPRWNILWVMAAGSAEGGSEIADQKLFSVTVPLDEDLRVVTMRNMFNHNNTRGPTFNMLAGNGWTESAIPGKAALAAATLPGADDGAVAFHSSGGISNAGYNANKCYYPPNDPNAECDDLLMMQDSPVWSYHSVYFRDDAEEFSHFIDASNEGICSILFTRMNAFAL